MKSICLALMRGSREQQAIGRCCSQPLTEPVTGNLVGAATQPVCFIHDHQIPASSNEVLKTLLVILRHLLARPSPAAVERLDSVEGTDDLRKGAPTSVRCANPRSFSSRMISPASIVLPSPTSSAR